mmetsp:Transcript_129822/g.258975  ORF Transcript_129822/g.258975 Transcript_129822/m.258975 type:complete len:251 (-) Transcript_129822:39-791(-)
MVTTWATAVLLLSANLVCQTLSDRDRYRQKSQTDCGILAGGEENRHARKRAVGSHHAPAPAPLNLPLSGPDLAAGGASSVRFHAKAAEASGARSKKNNGSKSSSGIQFAMKRVLAMQRGTTAPPNRHGHAGRVLVPFCAQDEEGTRTGCRDNCSCAVLERCYPKFRTASAEHIDIGVCNPAVAVLVFMSMLIIGNSVACMVVLRVFFQWRERIRAMMESGYNPEDAPPDPRLLAPPKMSVISQLHAAPDS